MDSPSFEVFQTRLARKQAYERQRRQAEWPSLLIYFLWTEMDGLKPPLFARNY